MKEKALRLLLTFWKGSLTASLESPSQVMRQPISRARRTVCIRLCLRGEEARRASLFVENGVRIGELGPQRGKAAIDSVFEDIAFIFVRGHPGLFFRIVYVQGGGSAQSTNWRAACQNPTGLQTACRVEFIDVFVDVMTTDLAVLELVGFRKVISTPGA